MAPIGIQRLSYCLLSACAAVTVTLSTSYPETVPQSHELSAAPDDRVVSQPEALSPQTPKTSVPEKGREPELYIEWDPVAGAKGYVVQVKDLDEKVVIDARVTANRFDFSLPPGTYAHRVGSLNRFGKTAAWSDWQTFRVMTRSPDLMPHAPSGIVLNDRQTVVVIKGKDFTKDTRLSLASKRGRTPLKAEFIDEERLSTLIESGSLVPGTYDLIIENPGVGTLVTREFLKVPGTEPPDQPAASETKPLHQGVSLGWRAWVPGLLAWEKGEKWRGGGWMGAVLGLAAGAGVSAYQADRLALAAHRSSEYRFFNDPVTFAAVEPLLRSNPELMYAGLLGWKGMHADQARYASLRRTASAAGLGALLTCGVYWVDSYRTNRSVSFQFNLVVDSGGPGRRDTSFEAGLLLRF